MREIARVGVDLAKQVIHVHAVDSAGTMVTNRPLPRDEFIAWCAQLPPDCLVAMEASSSAHHWARKMVVLGLDARIIAAHLVAPYRMQDKSGQNGAQFGAWLGLTPRQNSSGGRNNLGGITKRVPFDARHVSSLPDVTPQVQ